MQQLKHFREVWLIDFEYIPRPGERPLPVCMVAWELRSDRYLRLWQDQFRRRPPYFRWSRVGDEKGIRWPVPVRILDLFTEFRVATNGARVVANNRLLTALTYYGLDGIGAEEKREMVDLICFGGPWSREEIRAILDYCQTDVDALRRLLPTMLPRIDLPRALYRGRSMAAMAAIEYAGVPVDMDRLHSLRENWEPIQDHLVARIDPGLSGIRGSYV